MDKIKNLLHFLNGEPFLKLENTLSGAFKKLPHLPTGITEFLILIAPYFSLFGGIFSLLSVISYIFMRNSFLFSYSVMYGPLVTISIVHIFASLINAALFTAAFTELQTKKVFGWRLLFWSSNVNILSSLITLNFVSAVISAALSWYILYEIRSSYS